MRLNYAPHQRYPHRVQKRWRPAWIQETFPKLLRERRIEEMLDKSLFADQTVLPCGEASPEHCRRRPVLEYPDWERGDIGAVHL